MLDPELGSGSRVARRFGWGLADQALSSLTNFALGLLVARNVGTAALGVFALAFSTYLVALGLSRVFSTEPLVIRFSACSEEEWRRGTRAATGTAAITGLLLGLASGVAGWMIGGTTGGTFIALGVTLPGLLVQDAWRFAFFARSRGIQAFLNDLIWGLALLALFALALLTGRDSVAWLTAVWGAAAGIAALVGVAQAKLLPAPRVIGRWLRSHKDLSIPLLGESLTFAGSVNLASYLVAAIAGVSALGALRAAGILLGPTTMIVSGLSLVAVPEGARSLTQSSGKLRRTSIALSLVAAACVLAWGAFVVLLPDSVGTELLKGNWDAAQPLLVPLTIAAVFGAATVGARSGLKAFQAAGRILRTRVVEAAIILSVTAMGAAWGGAEGVAKASAAGESLISAVWWSQFLKTARAWPKVLGHGDESGRSPEPASLE